MNENNLKLRQRFVDDFSLPISVLESPYFEYQLELYNPYNMANIKWQTLISDIDFYYKGNENLFLEDYYACRDKIITSIEELQCYKEFISDKSMEKYSTSAEFNKIPKTSVYNQDNGGKYFLSIDLEQANFQALKYYNPELINNTDNYEDFIKSHLGDNLLLLSYFNQSKYTRQVIFGKLNMSRNVIIQNYLLYRIWNVIQNYISDNSNVRVHSKQLDELILELNFENTGDTKQFVKDFYNNIKKLLDNNIQIHFELYQLKNHKFETSSENNLMIYEKDIQIAGNNDKIYGIHNEIGKIKSCPTTYFPQVYKLITNQKLCENDLVFYYEKNLCRFLTPIKKIV
jgi:hypothetical protein